MRGRKPRELTLERGDVASLRQVASRQALPWFQVRRARTVLAVAGGERVEHVADRMQCDRATVWRTCRLYERAGLPGLLSSPDRPGRPERLSPPAEGAGRAARLPGAGRAGAARDALVQ